MYSTSVQYKCTVKSTVQVYSTVLPVEVGSKAGAAVISQGDCLLEGVLVRQVKICIRNYEL